MKVFFGIIFIVALSIWIFSSSGDQYDLIDIVQDKKIEETVSPTQSKEEVSSSNSISSPSSTLSSQNKVVKKSNSTKLKMELIKSELKISKIISENFSNRKRLMTNNDYLISDSLRAIKSSNFNPKLGEVYERYYGYTIYKVQTLSDSKLLHVVNNKLPVVYDTRRNTFGILTGQIILELKNLKDIKSYSKKMSLKIEKLSSPFVFLSVTKSSKTLDKLAFNFQKNPKIKSFEFEIINGQDTPN